MDAREIAKEIYYVGVNDRVTELFEALWPLPYGVSYNSYIVRGSDKTALIDTVKIDEVRQFLDNVKGVEQKALIDYLVINHMEPDHSGSIPEVLANFPEIKIIGNRQTVGMVKGFCGVHDDARFIVVNDGDTVDLGGRRLKFYLTPMVHWPETMMTYVEDEKLLFSGDAFGTFGALDGNVIDCEMDISTYIEEMYRYYSNIVGKYGRFVSNALAKLKGTDIRTICPTHGPVWRDHINEVIEITRRLAAYESEPGVVIVYGSMYGNTAEAANALASELAALGVRKIILHNASHSSMSRIISDAFRYEAIVVGGATYSMRLFPKIEEFLIAMETREIKNKVFAAFGSYTWAPGVTVNKISEYAERMKLPLDASFSFKQKLDADSRNALREFARQIVNAIEVRETQSKANA